MGLISRIIDRIFNRVRYEAEDRIAEKAVDKIFGKKEAKEAPAETEVTPQQIHEMNEKVQASAFANTNIADAIKQSDEIMKYMIFDDNMNWIGVKDDAPETIKLSYQQYLKEQNEQK